MTILITVHKYLIYKGETTYFNTAANLIKFNIKNLNVWFLVHFSHYQHHHSNVLLNDLAKAHLKGKTLAMCTVR